MLRFAPIRMGAAMARHVVRNRTSLPKLDKINDGGDWQPGDQQSGLWERQAIEDMDFALLCSHARRDPHGRRERSRDQRYGPHGNPQINCGKSRSS